MTDPLHANHVLSNAKVWLADDIDRLLNSEGFSQRLTDSINSTFQNGGAVVGKRLESILMSTRVVIKDSDTSYVIRQNLVSSKRNGMFINALIENYLTLYYRDYGWDDVFAEVKVEPNQVYIIVLVSKAMKQ